jgi:hypothetical protein
MAGSLENRGKLRELIDKFQFVEFVILRDILRRRENEIIS